MQNLDPKIIKTMNFNDKPKNFQPRSVAPMFTWRPNPFLKTHKDDTLRADPRDYPKLEPYVYPFDKESRERVKEWQS